MVKYLVIVAIIFGFGSLVGSKMTTTEVDFVEIQGPTKIIHQPGETVTVTELPSSCTDALRYASEIADKSSSIYNAGDKQQQIFSDARKLFAMSKNTSVVNKRQYALTSSLNTDLSDLEEAYYRYNIANGECEDTQ